MATILNIILIVTSLNMSTGTNCNTHRRGRWEGGGYGQSPPEALRVFSNCAKDMKNEVTSIF